MKASHPGHRQGNRPNGHRGVEDTPGVDEGKDIFASWSSVPSVLKSSFLPGPRMVPTAPPVPDAGERP